MENNLPPGCTPAHVEAAFGGSTDPDYLGECRFKFCCATATVVCDACEKVFCPRHTEDYGDNKYCFECGAAADELVEERDPEDLPYEAHS